MFDTITYKKKTIYVGVLFLLLALAAYKKNFKKVIAINEQLALLHPNANQNGVTEEDAFFLKREIETIEQVIGGVNVKPETVQQQLLKFAAQSQLEIDVIGVQGVHESSNADFIIHTNQMKVSGSYSDLMHFMKAIEDNFSLSKIVSATFETKRNPSNRKKELYLNMIFQNYEKK